MLGARNPEPSGILFSDRVRLGHAKEEEGRGRCQVGPIRQRLEEERRGALGEPSGLRPETRGEGEGRGAGWAAAWFPGSGFLLPFFSVISKPFLNQFENHFKVSWNYFEIWDQITQQTKDEFSSMNAHSGY